ncbi:MAG: hypothetical protein H6Q43_2497 [Deltaproteobacteria bacterium]|jgi:hypothetical protein|nr:hypothetical protein [Deltaproteobacteria bacterium]
MSPLWSQRRRLIIPFHLFSRFAPPRHFFLGYAPYFRYNLDGFQKCRSVPLGAGLRLTLVGAAYLRGRLHTSGFVRLASGACE